MKGGPNVRRMLGSAACLIFRLLFPTQGIKECTCGCHAYRASPLSDAIQVYGTNLVEQQGFHCMVDILLKLRRLPVRFTEVPFALRYDFKGGPSKMKGVRTIGDTLVLPVKRRFVS